MRGYLVTIRRVADGAEVVRAFDYEWESDFWWSDGNMGCDCNREREFLAGLGWDQEAIRRHAPECGSSRFVVSITDLGGSLLYADEEFRPW